MKRGGSECVVVMEREIEKAKLKTHLIFAYGTLKRGFPNHYLMEELMRQDDAVLVGVYLTEDYYPLVCGPHGIPYLINLPGSGHRVKGEVYAVSESAVAKLDEFEGVSVGCYERLSVTVAAAAEEEGGGRVEAEAYWGHRRFAEVLWKTKGEVGLKEYGEKEAKEYVRKENRPGGRNTILDLVP